MTLNGKNGKNGYTLPTVFEDVTIRNQLNGQRRSMKMNAELQKIKRAINLLQKTMNRSGNSMTRSRAVGNRSMPNQQRSILSRRGPRGLRNNTKLNYHRKVNAEEIARLKQGLPKHIVQNLKVKLFLNDNQIKSLMQNQAELSQQVGMSKNLSPRPAALLFSEFEHLDPNTRLFLMGNTSSLKEKEYRSMPNQQSRNSQRRKAARVDQMWALASQPTVIQTI